MDEYHKINSVYKRDKRGNFLFDEWSCPEFEYLASLQWHATEKIDGTNVRVNVHYSEADNPKITVTYGGRTDNAQMPVFLMAKLREIFEAPAFQEAFELTFTPDQFIDVTFYGEGYGAKIQKGGGNYIPDGVDFILFDVKIDKWWLLHPDVVDIADRLGLAMVPDLGYDELNGWIYRVKEGLIKSQWVDVEAEGVVLTPKVPLFTRRGDRIITKLKGRDFK